jgi:RimJ/RimL family protein N-acetyltransferase
MKNFLVKVRSRFQRATIPLIITTCLLALLVGYGIYRLTLYTQESSVLRTPPEEIKGKLVTLRTLTSEYFIDYHNAWSNIVRKSHDFPEFITLDYTIRYLHDLLIKSQKGAILLYCIFDNTTNKLIGEFEIREKNPTDPGQFGWWINEAYWGKGHAQEALSLITNVYFRLNPHETSYTAHVSIWNPRGYRALKKHGLVDTGYYYEAGKATRYILEMRRP